MVRAPIHDALSRQCADQVDAQGVQDILFTVIIVAGKPVQPRTTSFARRFMYAAAIVAAGINASLAPTAEEIGAFAPASNILQPWMIHCRISGIIHITECGNIIGLFCPCAHPKWQSSSCGFHRKPISAACTSGAVMPGMPSRIQCCFPKMPVMHCALPGPSSVPI